MIEAATGIIDLPDEDPKVFNIYAQWLYGGPLPAFQRTQEYEKDFYKIRDTLLKPFLMGNGSLMTRSWVL